MTKELEVYFANYFEMFRSEGWKQLLTDLNQNVAQINSVELTTDNDNLHFRKGQLAILATLFNLEAQIQNAEQVIEHLMNIVMGFQLRIILSDTPKKDDIEQQAKALSQIIWAYLETIIDSNH